MLDARILRRSSLLRARGGISSPVPTGGCRIHSSPRTRRYFHRVPHLHRVTVLFSAHAEVFPIQRLDREVAEPLLRARGGISNSKTGSSPTPTSSPRTRRYFRFSEITESISRLFSAHAEVFPRTVVSSTAAGALLRARGGISGPQGCDGCAYGSSPRTRRYFPFANLGGLLTTLFSAHAEVFPTYVTPGTIMAALLRARGGISDAAVGGVRCGVSSPRTRRYFLWCAD